MDAHGELEQLLGNILDQPPDPAGIRRLTALLHAHPELQDEYLDHLQLHALLQWRAGIPAPAPRVAGNDVLPWRPAVKPGRWWRRGVAAAMIFVVTGLGLLVLLQTASTRAADDVVESLVDWNLDLSLARSLTERQHIYAGQVAILKASLATSNLPPADRELAGSLLENGSWLTGNDDPMAEADRFNDIADKLVARLDAATTARDDKRIGQLADAYRRLAELGVDANLERAVASGAMNVQGQQGLEQAIHNRGKKLGEIMERNPEHTRKAIRRALKSHVHKTKKQNK